jgi:hypothetical protein
VKRTTTAAKSKTAKGKTAKSMKVKDLKPRKNPKGGRTGADNTIGGT